MHLLILGAGYAGLRVALEWSRLPPERRRGLELTLVDQHPYHQVVQLLHQTAASASPPAAALPLDTILHDNAGVRRVQAAVTAIDLAARQVHTEEGALPYDLLVLTLGGVPDYRGVPGAAQHAFPLRSYPDALRLRDQIVGCFKRAQGEHDPQRRRTLLTFAIAGGGYTGCQVAGELAAWLPELCQAYGIANSETRLALLQADQMLLEQFGPWATNEARRVLAERGVSVHLQTPVTSVAPELITLGGVATGKVLRTATLIWAAGWRAPSLLAAAGLPTDERGCVVVDSYLRVVGHEAVYACGDCARVPHGESIVPATASYAMRQGEYLAAAIATLATGGTPAPYRPLVLGQVVSLGPGAAIGDPLGLKVSGLPAALLKKGIEGWYLATVKT